MYHFPMYVNTSRYGVKWFANLCNIETDAQCYMQSNFCLTVIVNTFFMFFCICLYTTLMYCLPFDENKSKISQILITLTTGFNIINVFINFTTISINSLSLSFLNFTKKFQITVKMLHKCFQCRNSNLR